MTRYTLLLPAQPTPAAVAAETPLTPFADVIVEFVGALSRRLMTHPDARAHPELLALGYWLRPASIKRLQASMALDTEPLRAPRGTVLHIAPSNVDTIFVYSWCLSLLVGNSNIVRLSSKVTAQSDILLEVLANCLSEPRHAAIAARTLFVRYAPDPAITAELSAHCDVRVVWGGDQTVRQIREVPLPATAIELAFANKFSLAMIDTAAWTRSDAPQRDAWVDAFFNDAFWFDQMACSSPRLLLWVGNSPSDVTEDFWTRLNARVSREPHRFEDADYINKRVAVDAMAIEHAISVAPAITNDITRVRLPAAALLDERHCGTGLFHEAHIPNLAELRPLLSRKIQTVSYAGFDHDTLRRFVAEAPLRGIDRFVPFGAALNFASIWDGFDLSDTFMRRITID